MPIWLIRYAPQLLGVGLLALALWTAYDWAYDRGRASERARWEQANAEAAERFSAALAAQQARLEQLDAELGKARRQANQAREDLADALASDPASRDWAAGAIPDRVRRALGDPAVPGNPSRPDR